MAYNAYEEAITELDDQQIVDSQVARSLILGATATKPDRAAKSMVMAKTLGVPPEIVDEDHQEYEPQYRAQRNAQFVDGKRHLTDFINSNPMVPRIAQDDYENLDTWHKSMLEAIRPPEIMDRVQNAAAEMVQGVGSFISSLPKAAAITSRTVAEGRKEGAQSLYPQQAPEDDSPEARAAFRLRRGQLKLTNEQVEERRAQLAERTKEDVDQDPLYQVGGAIEEFFKTIAPTNEEYQGEFWASKVPSAMGSAVGFMLGGGMARLAGIPMGPSIAMLGVASQEVDQFEDAVKNGASLLDALNSAGWGAALGTTEALPIVHLLDRLDKGTGGSFKTALVQVLKQGIEEAVQSGGQKIGSNVVANRIVGYDPGRDSLTGAADDATVGFTVGAIMQTIGSLMTGKRGHAGAGKEAAERIKLVKSYIDAGEVPPPGVDNFIDGIHALTAKEDLERLRQGMKDAQKSQTRELAPELAEEFAKTSTDEFMVGISPEAIIALYGEEVPGPEDKKLGFINDLVDQIVVARQTGADVQVSLAKLMAYADPAVMEKIDEFIRMRPNAMTAREADEFKEKEAELEKIKAAAIEYRGKIYTGTLHSDAYEQLGRELDLPPLELYDDQIEGFVTTQGRFVDRTEAEQIALGKQNPDTYGLDAADMPPIEAQKGAPKPQITQAANSIEDLARREAGFDTFAHAIEHRLTLKKVLEEPDPNYPNGPPFSTFHIMNERGKQVGRIEVQLTPENVLYVAGIEGYKPGAKESVRDRGVPQVFGLHSIKSIAQQLKEAYPSAVRIGGWRVTGARDKAGATDWATMSLEKFAKDPKAASEFLAQLDEGKAPTGWQQVEPEADPEGTVTVEFEDGSIVKYRPQELWTKNENKVWDALRKIKNQIAPKAKFYVADTILTQAKGMTGPGKVRGVHGVTSENLSYIIVALNGSDPTGTLLHEVIHHLRHERLFTDKEWATLEEASKEHDWVGKHRIRERYPTAGESVRLEESIAEEYRTWVKSEIGGEGKTPSEIAKIFAKLAKFFAEIKAKLQEVFGNAITVDKLFTQISTGEIGKRPPQTSNLIKRRTSADEQEAQTFPQPLTFDEFKKQLPAGKPRQYSDDDPRLIAINKNFDSVLSELNRTHPVLGKRLQQVKDTIGAANDNNGKHPTDIMEELDQAISFIESNGGGTGALTRLSDLVENWLDIADDSYMDLANRNAEIRRAYDYYKQQLQHFMDEKWVKHTTPKRMIESIQRAIVDEENIKKAENDTVFAADLLVWEKALEYLQQKYPGFSQTFAQAFEEETANEEAQMFEKGAALGLTQPQFKKLMALVEQRKAEIEARAKAKAERAVGITKTEQWKENEPKVREEAKDRINQRPDIMADEYMRLGIYNDEEVGRQKINDRFLTEDEKVFLGSNMHGPKGIDPLSIGGLFGFLGRDSMIKALVSLNTARKESKLTHEAYKTRLAKELGDKLMMKRYGVPEHDALLKEAREDIISETQMDMLYEELMATAWAAKQAGVDIGPPFTKAGVKAAAEMNFATIALPRARKMEQFLKDSGKAGNAAFAALLKGDYTEAIKQKQRQMLSALFAAEAKKLVKAEAQLDRLANRFKPREVKGIDHSFTTFIKRLLNKAGYRVNRTEEELDEGVNQSGHRSLDRFVESMNQDGWEITMPDYMLDEAVKPIEQMNVEEFYVFKDGLDSMAKAGRAVNKVNVAGEEMDFDDFKKGVLNNIRSLPPRDKTKGKSTLLGWDSELVRMEEIAKDLDLREKNGPMYNVLIHGMAEAKHTEYTLQEKLVEKLNAIKGFTGKWRTTLRDSVANDFLVDPYDGTFYDMTRGGMVGIMLNFGNRSNIDKFTQAYADRSFQEGESPKERRARIVAEGKEVEAKLRQLFEANATKEDWQFAQAVLDIFKDWQPLSNAMYYELSGIGPKWIAPEAIDTRHGRFEGGYFPVIHDRMRSNLNVNEERKTLLDRLFGRDYFKATTANHYIKERTGGTDYIEFEGLTDQLGQRMQQMIHDIAYRRAVMNVNKVIYDPTIRAAIRKHYGQEYEEQLEPWVKDIANHFNSNERAISTANGLLRKLRFNTISHVLPFNLKVILSPSVGLMNPAAIIRTLFRPQEDTELAYQKSREIPHTFRNMNRDMRERLENLIESNKWDEFQAGAVRMGFYPVVKLEQAFRITTFVDAYKKAIKAGETEGDAVSIADSEVRTYHGAHGLPDLPAIMRSNEAMKVFTLFYGYFSTMHNWRRQLPNAIRRRDYEEALKIGWGSTLLGSLFGMALYNKYDDDDDDSSIFTFFKNFMKANTLEIAAGIPFARELANWVLEAQEPRTPVEGVVKTITVTAADVKKLIQDKEVKNPVRNTANVIGLTTGLPLGQAGRTGQGLANVANGTEEPKNILEWIKLIIFGQAEEKKGRRR